MISKSKLLWDLGWPTLELKLSTSVRKILGIILKYDKRVSLLVYISHPEP